MSAPSRIDVDAVDVRAIIGDAGRALRRPRTYRGLAREILWTGAHLALYPVGLVSKAVEAEASQAGRAYSPEKMLRAVRPEAAGIPIVLIHGYFHNRSAFVVMRRALRRCGFPYVSTWNYNALGADIPSLAEDLGTHVERVAGPIGAPFVHLVGHSLGGLIARWYVQKLGGAKFVDTCVTLGTPHDGTLAAYLGRGIVARDLRPGSRLLRRLRAAPHSGDVRFVSYYSNIDGFVIPASSAKLEGAVNILVKDHGHLSLPGAPGLIRSIADVLTNPARVERSEVPEKNDRMSSVR